MKGVLCFSRAMMDRLISLIKLFEEWDDGQACVCVCVCLVEAGGKTARSSCKVFLLFVQL